LGEVLANLPPEGERYRLRLQRYLATHVLPDVTDVATIIAGEGEEGVVKWFDRAKGYGFIRTYNHHDVFVHLNGIAGEGDKVLERGQVVRFKRRVGRETEEAIDVRICDGDTPIR
jgi:CspA family cold shock protein